MVLRSGVRRELQPGTSAINILEIYTYYIGVMSRESGTWGDVKVISVMNMY